VVSGRYQSKGVDILRLSRQWVFQRNRRLRCRLQHRGKSKPLQPRSGTGEGRGIKRKVAGGGGGQRAYVSEQVARKRGRLRDKGCLQTWNAEYKALSAEQRNCYKRQGADATAKHVRRAKLGRSSFCNMRGNTRRDTKRAAARQGHPVQGNQVAGKTPYEVAISIADFHRLWHNPNDSELWSKALQNMRSVYRQAAMGKLASISELDEKLSDWQASCGQARLERFLQANGEEAPEDIRKNLIPQPSVGFDLFRLNTTSDEQTKRHAEYIYTDRHASDLKAALLQDWANKHTTVMTDASVPIPDMPETTGYGPDHNCSKCWEAGVCICTVAGSASDKMANSFVTSLKVAFPMAGGTRKSLGKMGFLVAHLVGCGMQHRSLDHNILEGDLLDNIWLHIGRLNLSPVMPTFLEMKQCSVEGAPDSAHHERAILQATVDDAVVLHVFFNRLKLACRWSVQYYQIEDSHRPVNKFIPGVIRVQRYGDPLWFWNKFRVAVDSAPQPEPDFDGMWGLADDADLEEEGPPDGQEEDEVILQFEQQLEELLMEGDENEDGDEIDPTGGASSSAAPVDVVVPQVEPSIAGASASSSGPVAPPPLPPPPELLPEALARAKAVPRGAQLRAQASLRVTNGVISYYEKRSRFTAVCDKHAGCVLTRHATRASGFKGRPCSVMVAWLEIGLQPHVDSKELHKELLDVVSADIPARKAGKALLQGTPEGRDLLASQAPLTDIEIDVEDP